MTRTRLRLLLRPLILGLSGYVGIVGALSAQSDAGVIRIDEPVEWRSDATRGIEVERRSSLWVSGRQRTSPGSSKSA